MIGIIYGSTTGNTENVAKMIADRMNDAVDLLPVDKVSAQDLAKYDTLFLGSSTWGLGDLQDDWETKIEILQSADLSGKKVALFGCGDQESYPDTFVNALGILAEAVQASGAELIGTWPVDGYTFDDSSAVVDGALVGLAIDEDNQSNLTESRVNAWLEGLKV